MNIQMPTNNVFGNNMLDSTRDRLNRQAKRDNQIAFFEQQKENLKKMESDKIEDIAKKIDLLHSYDDQITAAKVEYNKSQMFHAMDEALERAEKIAEEAEKYAPKTREERIEEIVEEATGVEKDEGMLSEIMEEIEKMEEDMTENVTEDLEEMAEKIVEETEEQLLQSTNDENKELFYKRIDYRI